MPEDSAMSKCLVEKWWRVFAQSIGVSFYCCRRDNRCREIASDKVCDKALSVCESAEGTYTPALSVT